MIVLEFHPLDEEELLRSIEMLLKEWRSTSSQDRSSLILRRCVISPKRSESSNQKLILTAVCALATTSAVPILEDFLALCLNLGPEVTSKISKIYSDQSLSPTLE